MCLGIMLFWTPGKGFYLQNDDDFFQHSWPVSRVRSHQFGIYNLVYVTLLHQKNTIFKYARSFKAWTRCISWPLGKLIYFRFKYDLPHILLQWHSISIYQVLQLLLLHSFLTCTLMGHSHTHTHMQIDRSMTYDLIIYTIVIYMWILLLSVLVGHLSVL